MREHLFKVIAILSFLFAVYARSQTLNWGSLTQSTIVDSEGTTLNNTFLFQLGTFDPDFIPTADNSDQWLQNWRVYDSVSSATGPGITPGYNEEEGYFGGSRDAQDVGGTGYQDFFAGLQGYIWIRNEDNDEYFLASADTWTFPAMDEGCCPQTVVSWSIGDLGGDVPILGVLGDYDGESGPYYIQTHAVPEAASGMLALLGGCLALSRRRRKVT